MHTCILAPPLTAPYDGPYKVVARSGRVIKILIKGKVETVSLDRVKPAHLECEPTTSPTTQRTTPTKKQSSNTTRIASGNPQDPSRPSSANTQTFNRHSRRQSETVPNWPLSHSNQLIKLNCLAKANLM